MKKLLIIAGILILLAGIAAGTGYYFLLWPNTSVQDDGIIYIRTAASFDDVLETLQSRGYIKNKYTLRKIADIKRYPSTVKPGRYQIKNGISNNELINMLRSGRQSPVKFTFNNIRTLPEFAGAAARQLEIDSIEIINLCKDTELVNKLGFTPNTFIGMFIPNTYQIYWNISARNFVEKMYGEYEKFWKNRQVTAEKEGLTPMDVTILASIIEEETVKAEEYPIIAGVYINRLKQGISLAACPTLKFALNDFTLSRVLTVHTQVESPYNTYKYKGLPPGPVRMPSINVVDAVLNYQHHDYLFFCAKSDFSGFHNFSKTLRQHNEYARQYHQELNRRKIY